CARGKKKHAGSYKWEYVQDEPDHEDGEEWKQLDDYSISNFGRVKNKYEKFIKLAVSKGYKRYARGITVHQSVAKLFLENPENKPFVNHKNGDKLNNHFLNLEWVTPQENVVHAI